MNQAGRKKIVLIVVTIGLLVGGWRGALGWLQARERAQIAAIAPEMPAPASWPPILVNRIEIATASARRGEREGLIELAALYAANGWDDHAQRCLEGLRRIDPEGPRWAPGADPWAGQGYEWCFTPDRLIDEAVQLIVDGDLSNARARVERALMLEPANGRLHWRAALAWEAMRDQVRALAHYERAVEHDAGVADAWLRLATLQRAIGETSKAWQSLVKGVTANPDAPALLLARGNAYAEREQFEKALADFRRVVELRPNDPAGYLESGRVLFALGRPREAATVLEGALEMRPDHPVLLSTLAVMAMAIEDQVAADRWLARIDSAGTVPAEERAQLRAIYQQAFGPAPGP